MLSETRIASALKTGLDDIAVPPLPIVRIRERSTSARLAPKRGVAALGLPAAAAVVVTLLAFAVPLSGSGLVQSVDAQIKALLRWKQPPPAPPVVWSAMRQLPVTLAEAQARVSFALVPPSGVPGDAISRTIYVAQTGAYSTKTGAWGIGSPVVTFVYRRGRGQSFSLTAERFNPATGPPSKYMFEDMDRKQNGRELILRRDKFEWRNGDQVMTAISGEGIDATEIRAIRRSMHGASIPGVWPRPSRGVITQYRAP